MKIKFLIILLFIINTKLYADVKNGLDIKIFKNLRCLVCQGQTIAESNSDFAQTIKIVVRDKISQGNNENEGQQRGPGDGEKVPAAICGEARRPHQPTSQLTNQRTIQPTSQPTSQPYQILPIPREG